MQTYNPTKKAPQPLSDEARAAGMRSQISAENTLLTQTEARRKARELNDAGTPDGLVAIAVPVPFGSWGGREDGWTVSYAAVS